MCHGIVNGLGNEQDMEGELLGRGSTREGIRAIPHLLQHASHLSEGE